MKERHKIKSLLVFSSLILHPSSLLLGGGKSGLHRARWWVTPTLGNGFGLPGLGRQRAGQCNRK